MAKILLIDDDEMFRTICCKMLEIEGYEVLSAVNGLEGIKMFDENKIDLIITDIVMPEKEGLELIMEIKTKQPNAKIIAISGGGMSKPDSYLNIASNFGASCVFSKPFEREEFIKAVKDILSA